MKVLPEEAAHHIAEAAGCKARFQGLAALLSALGSTRLIFENEPVNYTQVSVELFGARPVVSRYSVEPPRGARCDIWLSGRGVWLAGVGRPFRNIDFRRRCRGNPFMIVDIYTSMMNVDVFRSDAPGFRSSRLACIRDVAVFPRRRFCLGFVSSSLTVVSCDRYLSEGTEK